MGAPLGNQNARKGKFAEAIDAAVHVEDPATRRRKLQAIAEKLTSMAEAGDLGAIKEIGDRLDGKAHQSVAVGGDADNPLRLVIEK